MEWRTLTRCAGGPVQIRSVQGGKYLAFKFHNPGDQFTAMSAVAAVDMVAFLRDAGILPGATPATAAEPDASDRVRAAWRDAASVDDDERERIDAHADRARERREAWEQERERRTKRATAGTFSRDSQGDYWESHPRDDTMRLFRRGHTFRRTRDAQWYVADWVRRQFGPMVAVSAPEAMWGDVPPARPPERGFNFTVQMDNSQAAMDTAYTELLSRAQRYTTQDYGRGWA